MIILNARRLLLCSTALILTGMLVLFLYRGSNRPFELQAVQARETTINNSLTVQGTLEPGNRSNIASSERVIVREAYVKAGDSVQIGDPLLRVERVKDYLSSPFEAAASYLEYDITENLQDGAILYADIDGIVSSCADVGETLYPAQSAVCLSNFVQTKISADVPELYAVGLKLGQNAKAAPISDNEIEFTGVLTSIDERITEKISILNQSPDRVVKCQITLDDVNCNLRTGTSMEVTIITDTVESAVVVPYAAVRQTGASEYVYTVSEEGIEKRSVETGYHLSTEIQIKHGVDNGEWVLTNETVPASFTSGYVVKET